MGGIVYLTHDKAKIQSQGENDKETKNNLFQIHACAFRVATVRILRKIIPSRLTWAKISGKTCRRTDWG